MSVICENNNMKIVKTHNPQKFNPTKIKVYTIHSWVHIQAKTGNHSYQLIV